MGELKKVGAIVSYYDPWVPEFHGMYGQSGKSIPELTPEIVKKADIVIITAAHHNVDYKMIQENATVIFDTKNVMRDIGTRDNVEVL